MTSNWWRQRVQADDGSRDSVNHPELKTTRAAVRHVACCIYIKENIRIHSTINHGCGHQWLSHPDNIFWMILPDFTLARHSPPILWPAPVWWLRLTPTPARPVYVLCPSLSLIILMMRYLRNVKLEQKFYHQKEFILQQQYMIWSFNVIVMRPIYSLGWMFSSFTRVQGTVLLTKIRLNVLTNSQVKQY